MMGSRSKALTVALIFLITAGCDKSPRKTPRSPQSPPAETIEEPLEQLKKEKMESLLEELKHKNPFSPRHFKEQPVAAKNEIELEGIMWDNQKPLAVIDGGVVAEGDFINGKKVIKIHNESVILDNHGEEEILKIKLKWD